MAFGYVIAQISVTDPEIYALEQSCIYRGPIWNFLCLELLLFVFHIIHIFGTF
mgnify:CR=1 FL=1